MDQECPQRNAQGMDEDGNKCPVCAGLGVVPQNWDGTSVQSLEDFATFDNLHAMMSSHFFRSDEFLDLDFKIVRQCGRLGDRFLRVAGDP